MSERCIYVFRENGRKFAVTVDADGTCLSRKGNFDVRDFDEIAGRAELVAGPVSDDTYRALLRGLGREHRRTGVELTHIMGKMPDFGRDRPGAIIMAAGVGVVIPHDLKEEL